MAERIYIFKYMCYLKLKLEIFQFQNDLKLFIFFFWFDRIFFGLPRWFSVEVPYSIVAPPGDAPPPKDWWHPRSLRCYTNARARWRLPDLEGFGTHVTITTNARAQALA